MIKLFGESDDLRTEDGVITKYGYIVMAISTVFGIFVFLTGRKMYMKAHEEE